MKDSVWLYRLYDIAEEFDLVKVEQCLAKDRPTSRLKLTRVRPKSIVIENPPVAVHLGQVNVNIDRKPLTGFLTAKVYDLGVVSLIMRLDLPANISYQELHALAVHLYAADLEPVFAEQLNYIKKALTQTYTPSSVQEDFNEDFTLFYFRHWDKTRNPVPILLAENEELSEQTITDTLRNSFSYGNRDLAVITWDSALVYDEDGSTDIPDLLEFALTQLLELRYYDGVLSEELNRMYSHIEEAGSFSWYPRLARYRKITKKLMEIVADVTEITEKVQNSLKVTEDVFYARVYGAALAIFRTQAWNNSIQHKISVIQRTYQMLTAEIENSRAMLVEWAIVLLILLEIILGLLKLF